MKKILALILAVAVMLSGSAVMAEHDNSVEGTFIDNILTITCNKGEKNIAFLTLFYDGAMVGAKVARLNDGCYTFELSEDEADKEMRIHFYNEETYPVAVTTPQPTAPAETPTPEPVKTPYPDAYEKPIDAINAPAVVQDVQTVVTDGELCYELTMLYQGRQITTNVREKVVIVSAPSDMASLVGEKTDSLKAGDVIHLTCDLQGRVKSIEFIYRPEFVDYFLDGVSTENAIGSDGKSKFVFGVAVETYSDAMEVMDADGNIYDLDVSPSAFVYNVLYSRKGAVTELYGTGAKSVPKVHIPDKNLEGTVSLWDGMEDLPYVLVRVSRDVATDIIVFK